MTGRAARDLLSVGVFQSAGRCLITSTWWLPTPLGEREIPRAAVRAVVCEEEVFPAVGDISPRRTLRNWQGVRGRS